MKYLRKFNESTNGHEIMFDEDMMYKTSAIFNLLGKKANFKDDFNELASVIKSTLDKDIYHKLFSPYQNMLRDEFSLVNFFTTTVWNKDDLNRMFKLTQKHEGSDLEDEWVVSLMINKKVVLLLASPDRGSSIRIQDDNYTITKDEVIDIVKKLCEIFNEKY